MGRLAPRGARSCSFMPAALPHTSEFSCLDNDGAHAGREMLRLGLLLAAMDIAALRKPPARLGS